MGIYFWHFGQKTNELMHSGVLSYSWEIRPNTNGKIQLCVIINVAEVKFLKSKEVLDLDLIRTISPKIDHLRPSETAPATKGTEVILFNPSFHVLNIYIKSKDENNRNHDFTFPMHFRINLQT